MQRRLGYGLREAQKHTHVGRIRSKFHDSHSCLVVEQFRGQKTQKRVKEEKVAASCDKCIPATWSLLQTQTISTAILEATEI